MKVRDMARGWNDLTDEERAQMIEGAEALLADPSFREAMDKMFASWPKKTPVKIEWEERRDRYYANMKDPKTRPLQNQINLITAALKNYRETHMPDSTTGDMGKHLGMDADIFFCIESGWTDPMELAGLIDKWAEVLGVDPKPLKDAIPGQNAGRGGMVM